MAAPTNPIDQLHLVPTVAPRRLHVLDIENLLGAKVSIARVHVLWDLYRGVVGVGPQDLVVVGCAQHFAPTVLFTLPSSVRVVVGDDLPDGADRALLDAVDARHQAQRFDEVVIGSGDHAFAPMAAELVAGGCAVTLATAAAWVSPALRLAATTHVTLPFHLLPRPRRARVQVRLAARHTLSAAS